jgi:hypothetical protein
LAVAAGNSRRAAVQDTSSTRILVQTTKPLYRETFEQLAAHTWAWGRLSARRIWALAVPWQAEAIATAHAKMNRKRMND